MTFSVSGFKANAASEGFHRSSHYDVLVNAPVGIKNVKFRTENISMPGSSFLTVDNYRPYSTGMIYSIPYSYNPQPISCTHLVDGNADMIQSFYDWANLIANLDGKEKFTANYYDKFKGSIIIFVYGNDGSMTKQIHLWDVYPESIDQVQLSWADTDSITKVNVSYRFTQYQFM